MYQLVIFDWDGTLMNSAQKIANSIRGAANRVGLPEPSDQQAKNIIGLGLQEALRQLFPAESPSAIDNLISVYKHYFTNIDNTQQGLFSNVEKGLIKLNQHGVMLAVATGKARQGLRQAFAQVGLEEQFAITRCADETRSKPHPEMLLEILEFTAINPQNSIMIGDTTYDMEMAENAGMHGLGVSYGVHRAHALMCAKALAVASSFDEVVEWLLDGRVEKAYD